MKKFVRWYKNTRLSARVIISMNTAILISIILISILATINRINVQKKDAQALVDNELEQITTLLRFSQDRDLKELEDIIKSRVLYNTGFISLVDAQGQVQICRRRQGQNISSTPHFMQMHNRTRGHSVYTDPVSGNVLHQYFVFFQPRNLYVVATLEKREFINKPVFNTLRILAFALIFTWITFTLINYFIMRTITTPINGLVKVVKALGEGELPDTFNYQSKDEVGQMAGSVNELVKGLKETSTFAREIGKNNFDHPFTPLSEKDILGNALLEMRQSLKSAREEEQMRKTEDEKRTWTSQGLAKFADILRQNNDNLQELSYNIIRNLVDYLGVNQGGIFILNDDDNQNKFLELTACYAFDRRKYLEKKIMPGEGLVGTCYLEQEPIYLTKVPQNYIRITSGLGDENPSAILLIPLKINEQVYGVIELAAFKPLEKYKMEFAEKIGESIASSISSVRVNTQTALLLEKSQQQAEEMRAQEEEMRQNMEELSATQEAMAEKERDNLRTIELLTHENQQQITQLKEQEKEIMDTLEDCPEAVVRSDRSGKIIFFNKAAEKLWGYSRNELMGKDIKTLMPENYAVHHDKYMQNYLTTGEKKIIGIGRKIEILKKSGQLHDVFLTIVETLRGEERFFTGFFSDLSRFEGASVSPAPSKPAPHDAPTGDTDLHEPDAPESDDTGAAPIADLHKGEVTDTQKAWSEHMHEKGKQFKKGRKK